MTTEQGKFEQAVTNIDRGSNPWAKSQSAHRDVIGLAAVLERTAGPGIVERTQLDSPLTLKPNVAVHVSCPGMNSSVHGREFTYPKQK